MERSSPLFRIIDANINRLKEGIRVVEDISRYYYNDFDIAYSLKELRHKIIFDNTTLLESRDIVGDVFASTNTETEKRRDSIDDIVISNFKRAEESSRVLEEVFKLIDIDMAMNFKKIRYRLYDIEKKLNEKNTVNRG